MSTDNAPDMVIRLGSLIASTRPVLSGSITHMTVSHGRAERVEDLRPPAPVPDGIAITPAVLNAARNTYLPTWTDEDGKIRAHCPRCDQGIADLAYIYAPDDVAGLVFAHMAQAHGWTRESTGE